MSLFFLIWCPKSQLIKHLYIVPWYFKIKIRVKFFFFAFMALLLTTVKQQREYSWVLFSFCILAPTVPFIIGRLEIPIFGNKAIPSWLWWCPNQDFFPCFFLKQKKTYLLMDSASLAQSQAHRSTRGPGCAPCSSPSFILSLFPPSYQKYLGTLSPIPSQWYLICYFFPITILNPALLLSMFASCAPSLSSPVLRDALFSTYSPEDALIRCFPPQSTHLSKEMIWDDLEKTGLKNYE